MCKHRFWLFEVIFDAEVLEFDFWGIFGLLDAPIDRAKVPKMLDFDTGVMLACLKIFDVWVVVMRLVSRAVIGSDVLREQL